MGRSAINSISGYVPVAIVTTHVPVAIVTILKSEKCAPHISRISQYPYYSLHPPPEP